MLAGAGKSGELARQAQNMSIEEGGPAVVLWI